MKLTHAAVTAILALLFIVAPVTGLSQGVGGGEQKAVYHLDDTANARWAFVLANAHLAQNPKARIAIVAHGPGVDFLLEDAVDNRGNLYDPAVLGLIEKGVEFRVCQATLSARNLDEDRLLDGIKKVPSGAYEIVRLQTEEGYAYLKP
jgi:intracellular sulfur oxidation DsrE/DsrF family protein